MDKAKDATIGEGHSKASGADFVTQGLESDEGDEDNNDGVGALSQLGMSHVTVHVTGPSTQFQLIRTFTLSPPLHCSTPSDNSFFKFPLGSLLI